MKELLYRQGPAIQSKRVHDISSYVQILLFGYPNDPNKKQATKRPGFLHVLMHTKVHSKAYTYACTDLLNRKSWNKQTGILNFSF